MLSTPTAAAPADAARWGQAHLLHTHRVLLVVLTVVTAGVLLPGVPDPVVVAPGGRVALETARFLVTLAAAGLLASAGVTVRPQRRAFIAALVVLGLTDLCVGVLPNLVDPTAAAGYRTLLPWTVARYVAGILFVLGGIEWPRVSTRRLVVSSVAAAAVIEVAVALVAPTTAAPTAADPDVLQQLGGAEVVLELVPGALFAFGAVLAGRLHERDRQPLEHWLAAALIVGVFTQVHGAAFPAGLGPAVTSADLLRAASTALLLVGAVQQVARLRADRALALQLSQADVRELREVSDRLRTYVDAEASFRSVVTHELATPVAAIAAYAHVLRAADLPPHAREAATTIDAEARRLRTLIERMDELADIDDGGVVVEPRPVLIRPLLEEAAAFGRALPGSHPVTVDAVDDYLRLDPTRMSQALRNLVGNASRHTAPGTAIVLTGRVVDDAPDGAYEITVSDDGPGFGTADAEHLFEKYRRGEAAEGREGTGLGLWIVRQIVGAHGGEVLVVDPAEAGARVRIRLPLLDARGAPT